MKARSVLWLAFVGVCLIGAYHILVQHKGKLS